MYIKLTCFPIGTFQKPLTLTNNSINNQFYTFSLSAKNNKIKNAVFKIFLKSI